MLTSPGVRHLCRLRALNQLDSCIVLKQARARTAPRKDALRMVGSLAWDFDYRDGNLGLPAFGSRLGWVWGEVQHRQRNGLWHLAR